MTSSLERFAVDLDDLEVEAPETAAAKALMRGLRHYPGGQDHDQDAHGNWAHGATAGGTATATPERGYPQYLDISPEAKSGSLSPRAQEARRAAIEEELQKWPRELRDAISQITIAEMGSGHVGETMINAAKDRNGESWITIHPSVFSSADLGKEDRIGVEWVLHHELAHAYQNYLMARDGYDLQKVTSVMREAWVEQRFSGRARSEMKRTTWYAQRDVVEAFAESVGMILSTGRVPGAYTKAAMQRLGVTPDGVTVPADKAAA